MAASPSALSLSNGTPSSVSVAATPASGDDHAKSFVALSPSKLVFDPAKATDRTLAVTLTLANTHPTLAAAFKFRTNAPNRYTVKPVIGVVGPGSTLPVTVRWEVSAGIPPDSAPDKFQLQACLIPADQASTFTADSWKNIGKDAIATQLLPTKFVAAEGADAAGASTPAPSGGAGAAGTASVRTLGVSTGGVTMEPYDSMGGLTPAAGAAARRLFPDSAAAAGDAAAAASRAEGAHAADAAASPAARCILARQLKVKDKEAEVQALRQRVAQLESQTEASRRRRHGLVFTKGHLVVVSILSFCVGLAWPWLRTLPPLASASAAVSGAVTSLTDTVSPYLFPSSEVATTVASTLHKAAQTRGGAAPARP